MNILKNPLKVIALLLVVSLTSCEDDFNTIGSDIIGENDFITEPYDLAEIITYSKKITAVQTSGLPQYLLGAYKDPIYGMSEASLLTQLSLPVPDPDFGTNPVLDSVVLVLPYYSTLVKKSKDEQTYRLDSVYGSGPFKLSVYESNYFLRDLDPTTNFEDEQLYYSDQKTEFENNLGALLAENTITPDDSEVIIIQETTTVGEEGMDTLHLSPRIRVNLPIGFFKEKIIDKEGSQELLSNANFQSYFRGLYLKAEAINGGGSMAAFNLIAEDAKIVLYYTRTIDDPKKDGDQTIEDEAQFALRFGENSVNVYDNDFQINLTSQDTVHGEPNLYLKGGEGAMAVIELFTGPDSDGNGVSDELEYLRGKNWLINEANLTFVVNDARVPAGENEPERIMIYDLDNNKVLADYQFDFSINETDALNSRIIHLGRLKEDENGNRYYKIRLTAHIRNIINHDSTNVKLGLVVSSNVNLAGFSKLKNPEDESVSAVPTSSVITPEGTVLYGNNALDENKRLKLNIFYTKSE